MPKAIYAYNHAGWYVQSVLLRAKLISDYPTALIEALTELMQARFPVAGPVQGYRHPLTAGVNAASGATDRVLVFARPGAPAVAVADGRILKIAHSPALGRYLVLKDVFGNIYTYSGLGRVEDAYAVPQRVELSAHQITAELGLPRTATPSTAAATADRPRNPPPVRPSATSRVRSLRQARSARAGGEQAKQSSSQSGAKERLFAYPLRPASYTSGGMTQVSVTDPEDYFAGTLTLHPGQYRLAPLRPGAVVLAGTILGRLEPPRAGARSHMMFMINPAGKTSPRIDPEPVLRSWELSEEAGIYGTDVTDPLIDAYARDPTVGQVLLTSKPRLQQEVLADPNVRIYACGRRDIQTGLVDQRVLAAIEYLSVLGLHPTISGLVCDQGRIHADGASFEVSQINETPVLGHDGPRSLTALTIHALLALQGAMRPMAIISLHSYPGQPNTLALPDHASRIEVDYKTNPAGSGLDARDWSILTAQLSRLDEPMLVPIPATRSMRAYRRGH